MTTQEFSTPLHDPGSFREIFSPGDTFYTFETNCGEPIRITGPLTIVEFTEDGERIICQDENDGQRVRWHISDLMNELHGVMRTEAGAHRVLAERQKAFAEDPAAQQRHEKLTKLDNHLSAPRYPWSSIEADSRPDDAQPRIDLGGPYPIDATGKKVISGSPKK